MGWDGSWRSLLGYMKIIGYTNGLSKSTEDPIPAGDKIFLKESNQEKVILFWHKISEHSVYSIFQETMMVILVLCNTRRTM